MRSANPRIHLSTLHVAGDALVVMHHVLQVDAMIDEYFDRLEDWKKLPAYKLEVRIDSLIGFALPKVIELTHQLKTRLLIPEFPLRLGTVRPEIAQKNYADRSYKIDFYIRSRCGQNLFIEFKSDSGSRRDKQDSYLERATRVKMDEVLKGILRISRISSFKKKYAHLLGKLREAELIDGDRVIIGPEEIRIIYVQPRRLERDVHKDVIIYLELAESIRRAFAGEKLMERLATSLERWAND